MTDPKHSQRLKQLTLRDKVIVNGFIRESQNLLPFDENPYYNLTDLIIQICLIYYAINEGWDILHEDFGTREDKSALMRKKGEGWDNANYGQFFVPSKGNYIYEWCFKIHGSHIIIGIMMPQKKKQQKGLDGIWILRIILG